MKTRQKELLKELEAETDIMKQSPEMKQFKNDMEVMYGKNPYSEK